MYSFRYLIYATGLLLLGSIVLLRQYASDICQVSPPSIGVRAKLRGQHATPHPSPTRRPQKPKPNQPKRKPGPKAKQKAKPKQKVIRPSHLRVVLVDPKVPTDNLTETTPKTGDLPPCPWMPKELEGLFQPQMQPPTWAKLEDRFPEVENGGSWTPSACKAPHRVGIVVPYRSREAQLRTLIGNLFSLLAKQLIRFTLILVEQLEGETFNRGALLNVGFKQGKLLGDFDCFVFHDVDVMPMHEQNLYACPALGHPRHMAVAMDKFSYTLPYPSFLGAAVAFRRRDWERINGASNLYWGWGGEDDDLAFRLQEAGLTLTRYRGDRVPRYRMFKHGRDAGNEMNDCRYSLLANAPKRYRSDGLSSVKYQLLSVTRHKFYTHILVSLPEKQSREQLQKLHLC